MQYAYVGCRTTRERNARGNGLKTYEVNEVTGEWKELQCLKTEENPSYQTMDDEEKYLYSVHGDITKLTSYEIQNDGTLKILNTVDFRMKNPVFITVDKTNKYIIVAALQGGSITSFERNADGTIGAQADQVKYEGKTDADHSFIHQCIWDQKKEYIFAPAQGRIIGYGQIRVFRFHSEDGTFEQTDQFLSRDFAEPRHFAMHPNNRFAYLINEKDNSVTYFEFDDVTGKLTPRQILPTLPETYTGAGQASAILVDPTGQIVLASNRIHESLALYRINQNTGYLTVVNYVSVLGKTPRFMTFSLDGSKLYVANEDSDTIVEMKLDATKGAIEYTGNIIPTESPVCITFRQADM